MNFQANEYLGALCQFDLCRKYSPQRNYNPTVEGENQLLPRYLCNQGTGNFDSNANRNLEKGHAITKSR